MIWLAGAAFAGDAVEEILVWADRFARWKHRWYVETEVILPTPFAVSAIANGEIRVSGFQIRAVLDCDVDFVLGPNAREVTCALEDVGLVLRPIVYSASDDQIVAELDATLTRAAVQLQVREDGSVPNVDLEGVSGASQRESVRREQLRQMISRAVLPFHLKLEDTVRLGSSWYDYESPLFWMVTQSQAVDYRGTRGGRAAGTASLGASTVASFLDVLDEKHLVIQSVGKATMVGNPPVVGQLSQDLEGKWTESMPPTDQFALELTSVGIVDRDSGILTERVWVVKGGMTASSPNTLSGGTWFYAGRLRMLAQDEHPNVGESWVARSGSRDDPRPEWVDLPQ